MVRVGGGVRVRECVVRVGGVCGEGERSVKNLV